MKQYRDRHKGFKELPEELLVFALVSILTAIIAPVIQQTMKRAVHHSSWLAWPIALGISVLILVLFAVYAHVSEWLSNRRKK